MNLFRLTINRPEIQSDNGVAGDRTLAVFVTPRAYSYSTYSYGVLDDPRDDDNRVNEFVYG